MSEALLHVAFPSVSFLSQAEFELFCREQQAVLDARFVYEQGLAGDPQGVMRRDGTCAPCLRAVRFSRAATDTDPNWREGQVCDCPHRLGNQSRAMLHYLEAAGALAPWSRVLLFGPSCPIQDMLAIGRTAPVHLPRLLPGDSLRLDAPDHAFTLAVCWDYLHRVPALGDALCELQRTLAPGGRLAFTIPFHYRAALTISRLGHVPRRAGRLPAEFAGEIHEIGWDILTMLTEAGFRRAEVQSYWSRELGYLGPFNLLFSASN